MFPDLVAKMPPIKVGLLQHIDQFGSVTKVVPALTEEVKDALVKNFRRRMTPQPLKFQADIEMKCFQFDGVLHIKDAMRKAEAAGNQDCPVKIKLVAPPSYVLITQTLDKFCLIQIQPMKNKLREAMIAMAEVAMNTRGCFTYFNVAVFGF